MNLFTAFYDAKGRKSHAEKPSFSVRLTTCCKVVDNQAVVRRWRIVCKKMPKFCTICRALAYRGFTFASETMMKGIER